MKEFGRWYGRMADKIIPLTPDDTANKISGTPDPLDKQGDITIENPDAPVDLPGYIVVDGVPEGGEDPNPTITETYPPTKGDEK